MNDFHPCKECHLKSTRACEQCPWNEGLHQFLHATQQRNAEMLAKAFQEHTGKQPEYVKLSEEEVIDAVVKDIRSIARKGRPNRTYPIDEIDIGLIKKIKCPEDIV